MIDLELLPWHLFLDQESDKSGTSKASAFRHIEVFREIEWPNMKRELMKTYNREMPSDLEPHWVEPGRAVFWRRMISRNAVRYTDESGRERSKLEDVDNGWHPTSGMSVGNASQLNQYLEKGFRLRPPSGVDVEIMKSAVPSGAFEMVMSEQEEDQPVEKYECHRHGFKNRSFYNWKTYIKHCGRFREEAEYEVPDYVMDRVADSKYYCFQHNKSFPTYRSAVQHVKDAQRRPGALKHAPATAMEVARFLKTDGQGG